MKNKDLYNLSVGDILIDPLGDEVVVLGVHYGELPLYHISCGNNPEEYGDSVSAIIMEKRNFKIK